VHVFQKKSGIATPKPDIDIIRERLKVAEKVSQEMRDE
jgi:phage-related protein